MENNEKNKRLKKILISTLWGPFFGYVIAIIISIIATFLGLGSHGYREMLLLFVAAESSIVTMFIILKLKKRITPSFNTMSSFVLQIFNIIFMLLFIYYIKELRVIYLILLTISIVFLINYATLIQSLFISLVGVSAYFVTTIYAISVAGQKGDLRLELFYGFCFIPTALLTSYMSGLYRKQREMVRNAKREAEHARDELWGEMELAKRIQTALLPLKPAIDNFEVAAFMLPASDVGGDYYNILNICGHDWIVIGDVSGHGVPAGLVMMMVNAAIKTVILENPGVSPSHLLTVVNNSLSDDIRRISNDKYMTISALAYHRDGMFTFSGLHQDIMIFRVREGEVESVETSGIWLGIFDDIKGINNDESVRLDVGDVMILFTDGITEARDAVGAMFSDEGLKSCLRETGKKSPEEIKSMIMERLKPYTLNDDVTLVVIKRIW